VHATAAQRLAVELALDSGDLDTARAWLEEHDRWLDWSGAFVGRSEGQRLWARYYELAGDVAQARIHAGQARALASEPRQPFAASAANRMLGSLAVLSGELELAAACLAASLQEAGECAAPYERALTLIELAELHAARGELDEALARVAKARLICEPLRAVPALARIAEIEARLPATKPHTPRDDGLSPREVDVLRLIAAGHSNQDIADELFISPRTVERHIANIYLKIDTHNRAEATQFALRNHLI
jgi:DNA-binding CsgD family transcriptional regulator